MTIFNTNINNSYSYIHLELWAIKSFLTMLKKNLIFKYELEFKYLLIFHTHWIKRKIKEYTCIEYNSIYIQCTFNSNHKIIASIIKKINDVLTHTDKRSFSKCIYSLVHSSFSFKGKDILNTLKKRPISLAK